MKTIFFFLVLMVAGANAHAAIESNSAFLPNDVALTYEAASVNVEHALPATPETDWFQSSLGRADLADGFFAFNIQQDAYTATRVPETDVYMILGLGLGMVGVITRRRKVR